MERTEKDNTNKFKPIPEMPEEIVDAIENNRLLVFVGAGVSKLYGYPLWSELGKKLVTIAAEEKVISFSQKETLLSGCFNPKEMVTIICDRFDKTSKKGIEYIVEELGPKNLKDKRLANRISKYLSAYNALLITTNADKSIETTKYFDGRTVLNDLTRYNPDVHNNYTVIHIHGSIEEPETMIFTSRKYAESYRVDSEFGKQLSGLFKNNWTILFLGYGVNEFELIRYFLRFKNDGLKRMFLVDGYLDKDFYKRELDEDYYRTLGITLLPFSREKKDYYGLVDVLASWDKDVRKRTLASSLTKERIIKEIVSKKPIESNIKKIESILKQK